MHRTLSRRARPQASQAPPEKARSLSVINLADLEEGNLDLATTTWMGGKIQQRQAVSFAMLWNYERKQGNKILGLLFADRTRSIMLRTHATRHWLPGVVQELIQDPMVLKITASWTPLHKEKLQHCFSLELRSFVVLLSFAEARGLARTSLTALGDALELPCPGLPQEGVDPASNWEVEELEAEQRRHAQEFPLWIYESWEKLKVMPCTHQESQTGIMGIKEGWEEQGVRRRHDGLYCDLCKAGPIGSTEQMQQHLEGKKHQQKAKPPERLEIKLAVSPELRAQGIDVVCDFGSTQLGRYFCSRCKIGNFHDLEAVQRHLEGSKHQRLAQAQVKEKSLEVELSAGDELRKVFGLPLRRDFHATGAAQLLLEAFERDCPGFRGWRQLRFARSV